MLLAERSPQWRFERAKSDCERLVTRAATTPLRTCTGRLGFALDATIFLEVIAISDADDGDLWFSFRVRPHEEIDLPSHWEYEPVATLPWISNDDFAHILRQECFPVEGDDPSSLSYRPLQTDEMVLRVPWRRRGT